jgi:hypothetical protein
MSDFDMLVDMGVDAEKWTVEFHAVVTDGVLDGVPLSELLSPLPGNLVHTWFCNAIEAGRSQGYIEGLEFANEVVQRQLDLLGRTDV